MMNFAKHPYHNFEGFDKECPKCQVKEEKLFKADFKRQLYNSRFEELKPFIIAYQRALKEIWQTKINGNDYQILEKYGLGKLNKYFGIRLSSCNYFDWDHDLKQKDYQLRKKI